MGSCGDATRVKSLVSDHWRHAEHMGLGLRLSGNGLGDRLIYKIAPKW